MNRSKFSTVLSLLLVFFSGTALGAFAYRLYSTGTVTAVKESPPQKKGPEEFKKWYIGLLTTQVKLDGSQVQQLNAIMDQTRDEFTKLNDKMKPERDLLNEKRDALAAKREAFFDKWRPEREAIQNQQVEKINAILRPDQIPLYSAFRAERDRQRKLRDQQRDQQHKK